MIDLSTTYMGLSLKNPIIASSSTYTSNIDDIQSLENAGVSAVVLKSLFEEEITGEISYLSRNNNGSTFGAEAEEYLSYYIKQNCVDDYLSLIDEAKKKVSIPVIASINAHSAENWIDFAKKIEDSGADGLEINIMALPSDPSMDGQAMEKIYTDTVFKLKETVSLPLSLKMGTYFSSLAATYKYLGSTGIKGMVLFNRYVNPDIDIDNLELGHLSATSNPAEKAMSLRWLGILSPMVSCDLAASTGFHSGFDAVKAILAGASAVYMASTLYEHGFGQVAQVLEEISTWMTGKGFTSIDAFRGKLNKKSAMDAEIYERSQFLQHFSSHT
jgi:dihydroorotate dehydrogenase (fumarate)